MDYKQLNAKLEFAPGETSKTATVELTGDDNRIEGSKKFFVELSFPLGGKLGSPQKATIVIVDDDGKGLSVFTLHICVETMNVVNLSHFF